MIRVAVALILSALTLAAGFTGTSAQAPKAGGQIVHALVAAAPLAFWLVIVWLPSCRRPSATWMRIASRRS